VDAGGGAGGAPWICSDAPEAGELMALRFHWSMSSAGQSNRGAKARESVSGVPDLDALRRFCRLAEECEMDSLLTAVGAHRPDPIALGAALGMLTSRIKFMIAVRSGLQSPTLFVQQINTLAALTGGRVCINVVAGHTPREMRAYGDFLSHDERYARTDEFLGVCRRLWARDGAVDFAGQYYQVESAALNLPFLAPDRLRPEIFVGGASKPAEELAIKHGDCLWRLPDKPERVARAAVPVLEAGVELGLFVSMLVRPTREEAIAAARANLASIGEGPRETHREFIRNSDSQLFRSAYELAAREPEWITSTLWAGAVPYLGSIALALVGSPADVADAILEYRDAGVTQFLLTGWPDEEQMVVFSRDVLPLVRARESIAMEV
jgi:alkanesulfonate monooxygenase